MHALYCGHHRFAAVMRVMMMMASTQPKNVFVYDVCVVFCRIHHRPHSLLGAHRRTDFGFRQTLLECGIQHTRYWWSDARPIVWSRHYAPRTCVSFGLFAVWHCLERQRGCGKIGSLLRPLFPPLDVTCPAQPRMVGEMMGEQLCVSLFGLLCASWF